MKKLLAIVVLLFVSAVVISSVAFSEDPLDTYTDQGLTISGYGIEKGKDYDIIDIYTDTYGVEAHNSLIILSNKEMTITGKSEGTERRIWIASPDGANLTFSNLTIKLFRGNPNVMNSPGTPQAAVGVADTVNGTVNITLEGTNVLESGPKHAGLENNSVPLVIKGTGSLNAYGYLGGAGIGGGNGKNGENITIESGIIYAEGKGGKYSYQYGDSSKPSTYSEIVGSGAGIGGGNGGSGVNITINNGTVTAKSTTKNPEAATDGRGGGAGIGGGGCGGDDIYDISGCGGDGKNIMIDGGTVKAIGMSGAGIGGGIHGDGENITIKRGEVYAITTAANQGGNQGGREVIKHDHAAGIGGGCGGNAQKIVISGGSVIAKNCVSYKVFEHDENVNFAEIKIIVYEFDKDGIPKFRPNGNDESINPVSPTGDGAGIGSGAVCDGMGGSCDTILICGSADVKTYGGNYGAGIGSGKDGSCENITICLNYKGSLDANGKFVKGDAIQGGKGEVYAKGSQGAAIGGGSGSDGKNITISGGGTVVACVDGSYGAGIGGGSNGNGDTINISGSVNIIAYAGSGAGIGGGNGGDGSKITITLEDDGIVKASGVGDGAGIGGGKGGNGDTITIDGGTVIARSLNSSKESKGSGAGIGGGSTVSIPGGDWNNPVYNVSGGTGSNITINGGNVTAESGSGAGIGGGAGASAGYDQNGPKYEGGNGSGITITGGKIIATSNSSGAGIGGGSNGDGSSITIEKTEKNKTITINATGGGAGIGGGTNGNGTDITISGGDYIEANGGSGAAGIGGGMKQYAGGDATGITISGGEIHANGGSGPGGAGIGSGYSGSAEGIEISGDAIIFAEGVQGAAGIGSGYNGSCDDITISSGTVTANGNNASPGINGATITLGSTDNETEESTYPWIYTNGFGGDVVTEGEDLAIVFNIDKTEGTIYGGKVELTKDTPIGSPCTKLTVKSGATFVTNDHLTLNDGVILFLEAGAKLDKYNKMTINSGEIRHEDESVYVEDASGKTVCDICGKEEPHNWKAEWVNNDTHHWHECDLGTDCSESHNTITTCSITDRSKKGGYGEHEYDVDNPIDKGDGRLYYVCTVCGYEYSVEIPPNGIRIIKVDSVSKDPLVGAQFGLYSDEECTALSTTKTTEIDTNPASATYKKAVVFFDIELSTTYYIKETKAPDGYTTSNEVFKAIVGADGKITYDALGSAAASEDIPVCENERSAVDTPDPPDTPTNGIKIIKVDSANKDPLVGAQFGLYSDEECTALITTKTTAIDTDNKAVVSFDAEPNMTYYIKETKAPNGYTTSNEVFKAIVGADGKITYGALGSAATSEDIPVCENERSAIDTPVPSDTPTNGIVRIIKVDSANKDPLAGAQFGLYSDEECTVLITTKTTAIDTDNKAVVSFNAEPNRTYYIKEINAPDGYITSNEVFKAIVGADGKITYGALGSAATSEDIPVCENERSAADTSVPVDTSSGGVTNPETGVGLGTAGFAILIGIVCTISLSKGTHSRSKRNNNDYDDIDF